MKRALTLVITAGALAAAAAAYAYHRYAHTPLAGADESLTVHIEPGSSMWQVARQLEGRGLVDRPRWFVWLAQVRGDAGRVKAGEYRIEPGTSPVDLLASMVRGDVIRHDLTLVEGWNFREMMAAIRDSEVVEHTLEGRTPEQIMAALGYEGEHPEGRFFPDTYHFPRGTEDRDILSRAYARMEKVLAEEWRQRKEGVPLDSPYEALILASIVEKETGVPSERSRIAGVFVRRLRKGMRLQTDPTVIYGIGPSFDGNLTRADLRRDGPYNTYQRAGLPPTPIAMPGREAIHAALHPAEGDALYFVSRGDGSHVFSATLEEHNRAVRRYQLGDG